MFPGTPPSSEVPAGPYPFMVTSLDGRKVPVVQAYAFGKYLGFLKVTFDQDGHVTSATGNPILLDGSVPQGKRPGSCWIQTEEEELDVLLVLLLFLG